MSEMHGSGVDTFGLFRDKVGGMRIDRRGGLVAATMAVGLVLSACGQSEEDAAAEKASAECGSAYVPVTSIPLALQSYQETGREKELVLGAVAFSTSGIEEISDPALKKVAADAIAQNEAFNAAKDKPSREAVLSSFRPVFDEYTKHCPDETGSGYLAAALAKGVNTSKTSEAVAVTPVGTTVKLGQPVTFEFTDSTKESGEVTMAVTEIVPIPSEDWLSINRNSRSKYGPLFYIRAEATLATEGGRRQPSLSLLEPQYAVRTSDGSGVTMLNFPDSWKRCTNEPQSSRAQLCQVVALGKDAKITEVSVVGFDETVGRDAKSLPRAVKVWTGELGKQ